MKTHTVELTLAELQEALRAYLLKHQAEGVEVVIVRSHDAQIVVHLEPNGIFESQEFRHRAN